MNVAGQRSGGGSRSHANVGGKGSRRQLFQAARHIVGTQDTFAPFPSPPSCQIRKNEGREVSVGSDGGTRDRRVHRPLPSPVSRERAPCKLRTTSPPFLDVLFLVGGGLS